MKAIISMILKFNFFVILNPFFCFALLISISVHGLLGTFFVSFELLIDFDFFALPCNNPHPQQTKTTITATHCKLGMLFGSLILTLGGPLGRYPVREILLWITQLSRGY